MIKNNEPLSMVEAKEYLEKDKENNSEIIGFMKKFIPTNLKTAKELRKKLQELDLIKLKPQHISKIIDIMPETAEDLNKIFADVTLDEDETKKILDTVKEFK